MRMYTVHLTEAFDAWLSGIKDSRTRSRLLARLRKASLGNLGDVKAVGNGIWEMREFFGPGWRMYYMRRGDEIILMLGGGDKSSQERDIEAVKRLAMELQDEQDEQDQNPSL